MAQGDPESEQRLAAGPSKYCNDVQHDSVLAVLALRCHEGTHKRLSVADESLLGTRRAFIRKYGGT